MAQDCVEVDVLGPARVSGTRQPFHRTAARELVVYLSFHRQGVRHGDWSLALWPDRPVAPATVHSTASDARRALGRAPDGARRLSCGSRLHLHPTVVTDVERFAALAHIGDAEASIEAVGLVRGPLFGGLSRTDWAILDGTYAAIEALVVHTVLQAAERLGRAHRAGEAEWAVRRGLLVSPYDERLYRALFRTLAAQGNRAGMRTAMSQLLTVAGEAPPVFRGRRDRWSGAVLPETTALYGALLGGWPAPGGAPARL